MSARRHHVGTRTSAFDVLPDDLMVLEYVEGITGGHARRLAGVDSRGRAQFDDLAPKVEKGKPAAGFRAFLPADGEIYQLEGVERVPRRVLRYVRYDARKGFEELNDADLRGICLARASDGAGLPDLKGSESQVSWGVQIRARLVDRLQARGRADLVSVLQRRHFARWFISRQQHSDEAWVAELEAIRSDKSTSPTTENPL